VLWLSAVYKLTSALVGRRGREALAALVGKEDVKEYNSLSEEARAKMVQEFEEHKATEQKAARTSNKSRVNDITHTVRMIEHDVSISQDGGLRVAWLTVFLQLLNLRSRTAIEALLFVTRGTTDLGLQGVSFATEGVERFLLDVQKVDPQDFMGRLEGYAIQGLKGKAATEHVWFEKYSHVTGAAVNAKARVSAARTTLRQDINTGLGMSHILWGLFGHTDMSQWR
jgi:hypothetical protein